MRAGSLLIAATLIQTGVAFAAEPMAPNDIKATFFDGKTFNAASPILLVLHHQNTLAHAVTTC